MKDDTRQTGRHAGRKEGAHPGRAEQRIRPDDAGLKPPHGGGTPDKQKTTGEHYAGGTKITSKEQGRLDRHGSAGASGPPGSSSGKPDKNTGR